MRIDVPGGDHWIELRGPDELTGADDDAWQSVYTAIWAERAEAEVNEAEVSEDTGDGMEVSADGVSMKPRRRTIKVPPNVVNRQRDILLTRLITAWSYEAEPFSLPIPYTTLSREKLPLAAAKALDAAIVPHVEAIKGEGPKETPGGTSASVSKAKSPSGRKGSPTARPVTA